MLPLLPPADEATGYAAQFPREMLLSNAYAVIQQRDLTAIDLMWLCAGYEANKPRVHGVTMSDGVTVREASG